MSSVAPKEARLVARTSVDMQELIKYAADLSGSTISQFLIEAAAAKAESVIEKAKNITLTLEGANNVFDALEKPPVPNKALLDAANRFKQKGGFYYGGDVSS